MFEKPNALHRPLRNAARFSLPLATLFLIQGAFAAQTAASAGQTVVSSFPEAEARQALVPDGTWVSTNPKTFTGKALMKSAFRQVEPAKSYGAYVYFTPGARTFWHVHPLGQTLLIVDGIGLTQSRNADGTLGPVVAVKAGEVGTCPPGIMHWHGASPDAPMTHLAISENDPKVAVKWLDAVDAKSYREGAEKALQKR